ncbi:MAG: ribonuclease P protein component [Marinilabiliaceae bacterium]
MQHSGFQFPKQEKLSSRKEIDRLFKEGKAFLVYPHRIQFQLDKADVEVPARALFSVPKKRFRRAVLRNRLKRRMREAYRLNKSGLFDVLCDKRLSVRVAFIFVGREELEYHTIENGMKKALAILIREVNQAGSMD